MLYLWQVEELQISIDDEQRSIADELRAATEEQKMSIEEVSGGASDAMAVDWSTILAEKRVAFLFPQRQLYIILGTI